MSPISLVIHGASGRNGRRLIALIAEDDRRRLAGAIVSPRSEHLGRDAGEMVGLAAQNVAVSDRWPDRFDAAIDFSTAEACVAAVERCAEVGRPIVVASTGLSADQEVLIRNASERIPVCYAANYSPAVNLTMKLAQQAAATLAKLGQQVDVEIIERHHRGKVDSPSGTALRFGQLIAERMGIERSVHGRHGIVGKRPGDEIGYHAVRLGDDAGQHTVCFGMTGELIELRCAASNRDPYAAGALLAADFLMARPPGLYDMFDVLGI